MLNNNISAIISTIRHGEKDIEGKLTPKGFKQGAEKGKSTQYLRGDVILLHSGVGRVQETLSAFAKYLGIEDLRKKEIEKRINYQGYTSHYLQYVYDSKNKGELFSQWDDPVEDLDENKRISEFLKQNNRSHEPEIYPSPKHMAIRMARVLATQIDFATITVPEIRTNFVNGTHEPVIMAFLYYFLQDFEPKNDDFINSIGGTVNFAEGFDIMIHKSHSGKNEVTFKFRNIIREIDQVKLKEFCLSENVI